MKRGVGIKKNKRWRIERKEREKRKKVRKGRAGNRRGAEGGG
jgi:hypothetical protein